MPRTGFIFQFSFVSLQQIFLLFCLLKDTVWKELNVSKWCKIFKFLLLLWIHLTQGGWLKDIFWVAKYFLIANISLTFGPQRCNILWTYWLYARKRMSSLTLHSGWNQNKGIYEISQANGLWDFMLTEWWRFKIWSCVYNTMQNPWLFWTRQQNYTLLGKCVINGSGQTANPTATKCNNIH